MRACKGTSKELAMAYATPLHHAHRITCSHGDLTSPRDISGRSNSNHRRAMEGPLFPMSSNSMCSCPFGKNREEKIVPCVQTQAANAQSKQVPCDDMIRKPPPPLYEDKHEVPVWIGYGGILRLLMKAGPIAFESCCVVRKYDAGVKLGGPRDTAQSARKRRKNCHASSTLMNIEALLFQISRHMVRFW